MQTHEQLPPVTSFRYQKPLSGRGGATRSESARGESSGWSLRIPPGEGNGLTFISKTLGSDRAPTGGSVMHHWDRMA